MNKSLIIESQKAQIIQLRKELENIREKFLRGRDDDEWIQVSELRQAFLDGPPEHTRRASCHGPIGELQCDEDDDWLRMAEWLEAYGFPGDDETLRDLDMLISQEVHG